MVVDMNIGMVPRDSTSSTSALTQSGRLGDLSPLALIQFEVFFSNNRDFAILRILAIGKRPGGSLEPPTRTTVSYMLEARCPGHSSIEQGARHVIFT